MNENEEHEEYKGSFPEVLALAAVKRLPTAALVVIIDQTVEAPIFVSGILPPELAGSLLHSVANALEQGTGESVGLN